MQMLKYSNHTDKLCHGFPRPPSGLLIHKENSEDHTVIFIASIITVEGSKGKGTWGKVQKNSTQAFKTLSNGATQTHLIPPGMSCDNTSECWLQRSSLEIQRPVFYWWLVTGTLRVVQTKIPDSQKESRCSSLTIFV